MWRVTDPGLITDIARALLAEQLIIADGHHRYETALRYREERSRLGESNEDAAFNYVLAYLTDAQDDGLVILPTHRVLHDVSMPQSAHLRTALQRDFRISLFSLADVNAFLAALYAAGPGRRIGCALAGASHYWLLSFDEQVTRALPTSAPLRALDVTVLHDVILLRFLGLPAELQKQKISYTIDADEALRHIAEQRSRAAFLLNPTTFEQILQVCERGETMPQKSTYFFPKLLTGLVFYRL
jgi:uncharacterized protein (DUF1015 family)